MPNLEALKNGGYKDTGLTEFNLDSNLPSFPEELLELGDTLEHLDFSGTGLSSLPPNFGASLPRLKSALFANCSFISFPRELSSCPALETIDFSSNDMVEIPEGALPPSLRTLVLTNNRLASLPSSIGLCGGLEKCILTGNRLQALPAEMAHCTKLSVLRLSSNRLQSLPDWLFTLPELSFLSFAGNPCVSPPVNGNSNAHASTIASTQLETQNTLHSGTSSTISQALWHQSADFAEDVALKLFHSPLTASSTPSDEVAAFFAAGSHESLITGLGRIDDHPDSDMTPAGLVMQLLPDSYRPLGQLPPGTTAEDPLKPLTAMKMLFGLAGAASHLHKRGIAHGELAMQNILASRDDEHALLTDFGAATVYGQGAVRECGVEQLEVLAFGRLVEDVLRLMGEAAISQEGERFRKCLEELRVRCVAGEVDSRPTFEEIEDEIETVVGWRALMRIPGL